MKRIRYVLGAIACLSLTTTSAIDGVQKFCFHNGTFYAVVDTSLACPVPPEHLSGAKLHENGEECIITEAPMTPH